MRNRETEAKVRCLIRQVGCLQEELRREGKRTAWALSKSKDSAARALALEKKVKELTLINNKLSSELIAAEESLKSSKALNDKEKHELQDASWKTEQVNKKRLTDYAGQLAIVVADLMNIETQISNARNRILSENTSTSCTLDEVRRLSAKATKEILKISEGLTQSAFDKNIRDLYPCIMSEVQRIDKFDGLADTVGQDCEAQLQTETSGSISELMTKYRDCVKRIHSHAESAACSERRRQEAITETLEVREELKRTKEQYDEKQKQQHQLIEQLQRNNVELSRNLISVKEAADARQDQVRDLQYDKTCLVKEVENLKNTNSRQQETISKTEAVVFKQRRCIKDALGLSRSTNT